MGSNSGITKNIENLKQRDLYSLSLFCLYKMIDIPEYSSLSEMAYILDKDNMLNLCEYFGGQTITIPTIDEITSLTYALLLYQYVKIEGIDYEEACILIGSETKDLKAVKNNYRKLCEVLKDYNFNLSRDI